MSSQNPFGEQLLPIHVSRFTLTFFGKPVRLRYALLYLVPLVVLAFLVGLGIGDAVIREQDAPLSTSLETPPKLYDMGEMTVPVPDSLGSESVLFPITGAVDVSSLDANPQKRERDVRDMVERMTANEHKDWESLKPTFDEEGFLSGIRVNKDGKQSPIRVFILLPGDESDKKRKEMIREVVSSDECQTITAPFNDPGATRKLYTVYYMCPQPIIT